MQVSDEDGVESNINKFDMDIRKSMLQNMLFPSTKSKFKVGISDIPLIMPPSQRVHGINKQSMNVKDVNEFVEGKFIDLFVGLCVHNACYYLQVPNVSFGAHV